MATIHFIGGEKGGVGKSLVARLMAQYLIDRQQPFLGFDSDRSNGALLRFYADYASPVVIDDYSSLDKVVEAAIDDPQRRIIVDLAAQTHRPLVRWMEESGMLELAREAGITVRYWHVMDSGRDSVNLLARHGRLQRGVMARSISGAAGGRNPAIRHLDRAGVRRAVPGSPR